MILNNRSNGDILLTWNNLAANFSPPSVSTIWVEAIALWSAPMLKRTQIISYLKDVKAVKWIQN